MSFPKRGEIWLTEFDPSVGTEIKKVRPALIISNDIANDKCTKVTVVPFTGTIRNLLVAVIIKPDMENNLDKKSLIRVPDVCTFDKIRLRKKLGKLTKSYMEEVDNKLRFHLGL